MVCGLMSLRLSVETGEAGRQRDRLQFARPNKRFQKVIPSRYNLCRSLQKVVDLVGLATLYQYWTQHFSSFFATDVAFSGFMGACGARPGVEQKQPKHVHPCLFPMYVVKVQRDMNGHNQLLVRFIWIWFHIGFDQMMQLTEMCKSGNVPLTSHGVYPHCFFDLWNRSSHDAHLQLHQ